MATLQERIDAAVAAQQDALTQASKDPGFSKVLDASRGSPATVRGIVGGARGDDKLATLRLYYPDAVPYGQDNFVFTNPDTKMPTLHNPTGFDVGDIAGVGPEISEFFGGAFGGSAAIPLTGGNPYAVATGIGLGAGAGREAYDLSMQAFGPPKVDTRTVLERLTDAGTTVALNAAGQRVGDIGVEAAKAGFRGIRNRVAGVPSRQLLSDMLRAGVTPRSAGAITGRRGVQFLEQGLGATIAGGEVVAKRAQQTIDEIYRRVVMLADELSPAQTILQAGTELKRGGIGYIKGFRKEVEKLERKFVALVPKRTMARLDNTITALQGVSDRFPTNPELGQTLMDPTFQKWAKLLEKSDGLLSFGELREFRAFVGRKLGAPAILDDIPRADLKKLYGAMSEDLRAVATGQGDDALKAFNTATRYERQGFKRIESALEEIAAPDAKYSAESVYATVEGLMREGTRGADLRKLALIRKSVEPEHWQALGSVILRRMGRAAPGAQDVAGEAFSPEKFLTQWNRLSPQARKILFEGTVDEGWVAATNSLVRVVGALKDLSRQANTSGTARVFQAMGTIGIFGGAAGSMLAPGEQGVQGALQGAAAGVGGRIILPHVAARLLTNTNFVKWLARLGDMPRSGMNSFTKHLGRLAFVSEVSPEIREEISTYAEALTEIAFPVRD